jgi:hypothetical protein
VPKPHNRGFSGLITPPEPLPDEDADAGEGAIVDLTERRSEPEPTELPVAQTSLEAKTPAKRQPERKVGGQAPASRVALTVRLHEPAARALNDAWLNERRQVNPKLSYPEFASEVVRLGLAAFERKQSRSDRV